jgi:hypothetical protein
MTTIPEWIKEQTKMGELKGTVVYNEDEDSYQLRLPNFDIGLCNPFWDDYEGKLVKIKIEVIQESVSSNDKKRKVEQ